MLETLADLFYNPLLFWGLPLPVVAALGLWRHYRDKPPGEKPESHNDCPKNQT